MVSSLLLALPLIGCGARSTLGLGTAEQQDAGAGGAAADSGTITFPLGTFTDCAMGEHNPDGAVMNVSGFEPGATLELARSGAAVTATFTDFNGSASTLDFFPTTNRSAILAHNGQVSSGFMGLCVHGVGVSNEEPFPATLEATDGTLMYDSGTVFLTATGTLSGDGGTCGDVSVGGAFWVACRQGPTTQIDSVTPPAIPALPVGSYTCTSQIDTLYESGGQKQIVTSGGDGGTLLLSQSGATLKAQYSGDKFVTGTLELRLTSATTAIAALDQSLTTACEVPIGIGVTPSMTPETLPVPAASLGIDGSTLILSFSGTMDGGSSCNAAQKAGSLICSPQ